jgi:hypothetical protein
MRLEIVRIGLDMCEARSLLYLLLMHFVARSVKQLYSDEPAQNLVFFAEPAGLRTGIFAQHGLKSPFQTFHLI